MTQRRLDDPLKLMQVLRAERERRKATGEGGVQKEIASALGVSIAQVSLYESEQDAPSRENLEKWLRFYGLPVEWAQAWFDARKKRDILRILDSFDPPLPPDQRDSVGVQLEMAMRLRRA